MRTYTAIKTSVFHFSFRDSLPTYNYQEKEQSIQKV